MEVLRSEEGSGDPARTSGAAESRQGGRGGGRGWDDTAAASVSGGAPRGTADAFRHVGLLAGVG